MAAVRGIAACIKHNFQKHKIFLYAKVKGFLLAANPGEGGKMNDIMLRKLAVAARTDLVYISSEGAVESLTGLPSENPAVLSTTLRNLLTDKAASQSCPVLFHDAFGIYFSCVCTDTGHYFIGPMNSVKKDSVAWRKFRINYGIKSDDASMPHFFSIQEILCTVELIAQFITGKVYDDAGLLTGNQLASVTPEADEKEQALYLLKEDDENEDEETWRHSYRQERSFLEAVTDGNADEALRLNRIMDQDAGRLSSSDCGHWKIMAVIGITLSARAAIEGGLSPQTAYQISGYYIKKCDTCETSLQAIHIREHAISELARKVGERKAHLHTSNYTETAKSYVAQHYREKIYLEEIAGKLGISPSYLSRIFKNETGTSLNDYICGIRIDRAANLLKYSDLSLSEIASYVNFPSQSYFGKVFKPAMHMTPKEYRDRYKTTEWQMDEAASHTAHK